MTDTTSLSLSVIIGGGIAAQWLSWKFRIPAIVSLICTGLLVGPGLQIINPDELFGDKLTALISLSLGIILFEGGLTLNFREIKLHTAVVRNLVTLGALVTWILCAFFSVLVLELDWSVALLFSACIVVSGPTVIIPLLRQLRLKGNLSSLLKWEGIVIDPIGVTLAVMVFEVIRIGTIESIPLITLKAVCSTLFVGLSLGYLGAWLIIEAIRRYLLPDYLQSPMALCIVLLTFSVSNLFQAESGLLTSTVMGILLANQKKVNVKPIVEFKENLQVLIISGLFVLLSARVQRSEIADLGVEVFIFLAIVTLFIRPLMVWLVTLRSGLTRKERLFLGLIAPRGIVAASTASVFALELEHIGIAGAERLAPLTFAVVLGTVVFYGVGAPFFARWLNLHAPHPQGTLIVGAHFLARKIGAALVEQGQRVLLVDTNRQHVLTARKEGLPVYHGSIYLDHELDTMALDGLGRLIALTPNDEVNTLAALHFTDFFGGNEVYQLRPTRKRVTHNADSLRSLRSRILFSRYATYEHLAELVRKGAQVITLEMEDEEAFAKLKNRYHKNFIPLFHIDGKGILTVFARGTAPVVKSKDKVVCLLLDEPMANSSLDPLEDEFAEEEEEVEF